jgi:hypothetical protein
MPNLDGELKKLGANYTPIQEEIAAQIATKNSFLAFGVVEECLDLERAGRLRVRSSAFPRGVEVCDYVSPVAGGDYGLFAMPGIGATVLVGQTPFHDPPTGYFWLGCLYAAGSESCDTQKTQPYHTDESGKQLSRTVVKDDGSEVTNVLKVSYGVPDEEQVYGTNNLPDSFVLKHPCGHALFMTDKKAAQNEVKEIKLKSAENKRLILSDGPPSQGGDHIILCDESNNQIRITSNSNPKLKDITDNSIYMQAKGQIDAKSMAGGVALTVGPESEDDIDIQNTGKGNINIKAYGKGGTSVHVQAPKEQGSIVLSCGESSIEINGDSITIKSPKVNIDGGLGDVNVNNISLTGHKHIGNVGAPVSLPF